jgi:hypothetical protein
MGNQGHSGDGTRLVCEWLGADVIGPVRDAHVWTSRPAQGNAAGDYWGSRPNLGARTIRAPRSYATDFLPEATCRQST